MNLKTIHIASLSLLLAALVSGLATSQTAMKLEGDGFFMMSETGALIVQKKDTLKVAMVPPSDARPKQYANVDLKEGDIILLVNGKKFTSANQLEELFKTLKPGDEISLGIKREGALRLVKFARADESTLPKRQMMLMRKTDGEEGGDQVQIQTKDGVREFSGDGVRILPSSGLVIGAKGKDIVVLGVMPMAAEKISGGEVKEGDMITAANGKSFAVPDDMASMIDDLPDGTKVELTVSRAGKTFPVTITKAPEAGRRVIKMGK